MDPDETQMFVDAFWWRLEIEDRQQAHYASMQLMAAGVKKEKAQPKKVRFLSEWQDDSSDAKELDSPDEKVPAERASERNAQHKSKKQRDEEDREAMRRLKAFSRQRAAEQRAS